MAGRRGAGGSWGGLGRQHRGLPSCVRPLPRGRRKGTDEGPRSAESLCFRAAPVQYEGPGVEALLTPSEDGDAHVLLRLRQRFCGLARCLGLMLRCERGPEGRGCAGAGLGSGCGARGRRDVGGCGVTLGSLCRGSLCSPPLQLRVRGSRVRPRAGNPGRHLPDPQHQCQEHRECRWRAVRSLAPALALGGRRAAWETGARSAVPPEAAPASPFPPSGCQCSLCLS